MGRQLQKAGICHLVHVELAGGQCKAVSLVGHLVQPASRISAFSHAPCRLRLASNVGGVGEVGLATWVV
ncbi:hypothetical protein V6N13_048446 [Hibiscus sabdariffa]